MPAVRCCVPVVIAIAMEVVGPATLLAFATAAIGGITHIHRSKAKRAGHVLMLLIVWGHYQIERLFWRYKW
jgi:hypothetical protein